MSIATRHDERAFDQYVRTERRSLRTVMRCVRIRRSPSRPRLMRWHYVLRNLYERFTFKNLANLRQTLRRRSIHTMPYGLYIAVAV